MACHSNCRELATRLVLLLPLAVLVLAVGCSGGGGGSDQGDSTTLATGTGTLTGIAIADGYAYAAEETESGSALVALPLAGGDSVQVATTTGEIPSLDGWDANCVYVDEDEMTVAYASVDSDPVVLSRSSVSAAKAVAVADDVAYWVKGSGTELVSLELPSSTSGDDPPTIELPEIIGTLDAAELLSAGSSYVWLADQSGARLSYVALAGGTPTGLSSALGAIASVAADGTRIAVAASTGVYVSGTLTALPDAGTPRFVGLLTDGAVAASSSHLYYQMTGASTWSQLATVSGLVGLDASGDSIVLAENVGAGGRVRLISLAATE
jgi:hypothetical protein